MRVTLLHRSSVVGTVLAGIPVQHSVARWFILVANQNLCTAIPALVRTKPVLFRSPHFEERVSGLTVND